eukprot:Platyproteum_vivax@DN14082_c0_g1_i1.p1
MVLTSITQHAAFESWSPAIGRQGILSTFQMILEIMNPSRASPQKSITNTCHHQNVSPERFPQASIADYPSNFADHPKTTPERDSMHELFNGVSSESKPRPAREPGREKDSSVNPYKMPAGLPSRHPPPKTRPVTIHPTSTVPIATESRTKTYEQHEQLDNRSKVQNDSDCYVMTSEHEILSMSKEEQLRLGMHSAPGGVAFAIELESSQHGSNPNIHSKISVGTPRSASNKSSNWFPMYSALI